MPWQRTENYGPVICGECGKEGYLQAIVRIKRNGEKRYYYRVTHYKGDIELRDTQYRGSGFRGEYDYTCYLGKDIWIHHGTVYKVYSG